MTMTPTQREAALRLADWLHASGVVNSEVKETIALLRELLAEPQSEPVQEPVATLHDDGYWTPKQSEAGRRLNDQLMRAGTRVDVYTVAQQRNPLSEEQIVMMWGHRSDGPDTSEIVSFARAIERAHGIGD